MIQTDRQTDGRQTVYYIMHNNCVIRPSDPRGLSHFTELGRSRALVKIISFVFMFSCFHVSLLPAANCVG